MVFDHEIINSLKMFFEIFIFDCLLIIDLIVFHKYIHNIFEQKIVFNLNSVLVLSNSEGDFAVESE